MIYWATTRIIGALFGLLMLRTLDEGLWDDALLKGAWQIPPLTPAMRFQFLVACTIATELVMMAVAIILAWIKLREDSR